MELANIGRPVTILAASKWIPLTYIYIIAYYCSLLLVQKNMLFKHIERYYRMAGENMGRSNFNT